MNDFFRKIIKLKFFPYVFLSALIFGLYGQTLFFDFSSFDDYDLIVKKYYFISNPQNIPQAFRQEVFMSSHGVFFRPILTLTFMIDAFIGRLNPFQYHLSNVLFHVIAVLLLFILLIHLKLSRTAAFISSMVFAVHPILTQAVAWIPGRNDSLLFIFIAASFYFFLRLRNSEVPISIKRLLFYFFHLFFFFLALLTKETALIFPVMLVFYLVIVERSNAFNKNNFLMYFCWGVLILIWYVMRMNAIAADSDIISRPDRNFFTNSIGFLSYLGKVFSPINLSVIPIPESINIFYVIPGIVLMLAIFLINGIRDLRNVLFGLLWYIIFLLPTFVNVTGFSNYLEHRTYVPIFGIIIAVSESKILLNLKSNLREFIFSVVIVIFIIITFKHSRVFSSSELLWSSAAKDSPNSFFVRKGLGNAFHRLGMYQAAEIEYLKAVELEPKSSETINNLGLNYKKMGVLDKAEDYFKRAIKINPIYSEPRNNLGIVYSELNKVEDAEKEFLEAIKIKPDYFEAYNNLGTLYARNDQLTSAKYHFEKALEINPRFAEAHYNLMIYHYSQKNYELSIYHCDKAIENGFKIDELILDTLEPYRK